MLGTGMQRAAAFAVGVTVLPSIASPQNINRSPGKGGENEYMNTLKTLECELSGPIERRPSKEHRGNKGNTIHPG